MTDAEEILTLVDDTRLITDATELPKGSASRVKGQHRHDLSSVLP